MGKNHKIRFYYIFSCISIVISTGSIILYQLAIKKLIEQVELFNGVNIVEAILGLLFFIFLQIISPYIKSILQALYRNELCHHIRIRISVGILNKPIEDFTKEINAKYISIFNNDIKMVVEDFYISGLEIFECFTFIVFSIGALLTINKILALVLIVGNFLMFLNPLFFEKFFTKAKVEISKALKQYNLQLTDFMQGIPIIKTYLIEPRMIEKIKDTSKYVNRTNFKYSNLFAVANIVGGGITTLRDFIILVIGIWMISSGDLTIGALLATLQISEIISHPVVAISYYINNRNSIKPLKKQIDEMIKTPRHEGIPLYQTIEDITIQNLAVERENKYLIKDINYTFKKGMKYLIIGESGCGKSTLLHTIYNTYKISKGDIRVNKISSHDLNTQDYYSQVKMLYQESYLFEDSIKNNITLGLEYNKTYLDQILSTLQLHNITDSAKLSGGEKQRIALARALVTEPQVLLVDEITASLDSKMAKTIEELLLNSSMLIINVTHKPCFDMLDRYDEIIIMSNGTINARGTYKDLKKMGHIA